MPVVKKQAKPKPDKPASGKAAKAAQAQGPPIKPPTKAELAKLGKLERVLDFVHRTHVNSIDGMVPSRCLSIRQPWAMAIALGWKSVENRTWPPGVPNGTWIAIHASGKPGQIEQRAARYIEDAADYCLDYLSDESLWPINPTTGQRWCPADSGSIIGIARVVTSLEYPRGEFLRLCEKSGFGPWWTEQFNRSSIPPDYWAEKATGGNDAHCWLLSDMRLLAEPIPTGGKLNLWRMSQEQITALAKAKLWPADGFIAPPEQRMLIEGQD